MRWELNSLIPLFSVPCPVFISSHPSPWVSDAGMYEPLYFSFDAYPSVVPRVRVRGVMALFLAVTILWALIW